ncbi:MAG: type IV toxin-antitoxin system AbiEi family antitoxin domain-containing protein [Ornithinimicrobium sp.]
MNPDLQALLNHQHHIATSGQAGDVGIGSDELMRHVADGELIRLARGAYADTTVFSAATDAARHVLRARGVLATLPIGMPLSHHSAAALWSLPWLGDFPDRVHVMRADPGHHRRSVSHTIHRPIPGIAIDQVEGLPVVEPAYTLLGIAAHHGFRQTVVALDAARHVNLVGEVRIAKTLTHSARRSGRGVLLAARAASDPQAESPGETLTRLLLRDLGYAVQSQAEVTSSNPDFRARVDFLLGSHGVVIEFDGLLKYAAADGAANRSALILEKAREDRLRSLGFESCDSSGLTCTGPIECASSSRQPVGGLPGVRPPGGPDPQHMSGRLTHPHAAPRRGTPSSPKFALEGALLDARRPRTVKNYADSLR